MPKLSLSFSALVICVAFFATAQHTTAQIFRFDVAIDGAQAGTGSAGTGAAAVIFDTSDGSIDINGDFSGLNGETTVAHLHGFTGTGGSGNAGVLVGLDIDTGVSSGAFSGAGTILDEATNFADLFDGQSYINIHSSTNTGGEIRGFLTNATAVPEPSSIAVLGFMSLLALRTRRRS